MSERRHLHVHPRLVLVVAVLSLTLPASLAMAQGRGPGPGPGAGPGPGGGTNLSTFVTADFSGSGNCATCHSNLRDSAGNDVSMDTHWRSTMMANAAKDPLWQAKIQSEVLRNPALQPVIEDKCTRCHMPMARTQAVTDGTPVGVLGSGFLDPAHPLNAAAGDGVSCSLCHQVRNEGLGGPATFTGGYVVNTSTSAPNRLIYAKFANPMQAPMRNAVGYTPVQGPQTTDSGFCGVCHVLYTPMVDAQGNVLGEFPEQMTYLEWENSAYGDGMGTDQSCQDCHLPLAAGPVKISNRPMRLAARSPFHQHHYVGGNALLIQMLKGHQADLGVTASGAQLDATLGRIAGQLSSSTAGLQVTGSQVANGTLTLSLAVQNRSGHKLPSGIPTRRVWLHVTVKDAAGTTFFESGRPLADGSIQGDDQDAGTGSFEPHYDLISQADQVQIYETAMLDSDGQLTYTLLRAAAYAKDNRLLPAGLDKAAVHADIATWGRAATDGNFVGGSDAVTYAIDVQGRSLPLAVSAELLYQATSWAFVSDLRQDSGDLVQRFAGYYDRADRSPMLVSSVQVTVR